MLNKFTIQKSFAISAGAGSGKTYTLSRRYINAILGFDYFREDYRVEDSFFSELKPAKVDEIVTITYTEAAALEMRSRIFGLVSKIIDLSLSNEDKDYNSINEANQHITQEQKKYVLQTLQIAYKDSSNSKISTIHSYCLDIIKTNSDIARIDTKLDIIKDDEKLQELSRIVFEVLNDEQNKKLVLDISQNISLFLLNNLINRYVSNSKFRKDYDSFTKNSIDRDTYKELINELYPLTDVEDDFEIVKSYITSSNIVDSTKYIDFLEEYISNFLVFKAQSWSSLSKEKDIVLQFNRKPWTQHKSIKENIDNIKSLDSFSEHYSFIDEEKEKIFFDKIDEVKELLHQIKYRYDKRLNDLQKVDFDTIITKTLEIIPKIKTDFRYIMVDEFQDTNALQFEIIKHSCHKETNLFVVGDSKQAIYSFQGAEIEVFNDAIYDKKLFSSIEIMDKNHRSDGVILKNIDKIFDELLKPNENLKLIKPNYEASIQNLYVFDKEREDKGSFKFLITSKSEENQEDELDSITEFIYSIKSNKLKEYSHIANKISNKEKAIAIMFDSSTKMLELKQKLKQKGIVAKVSASENFYHTKEINDIFNLLKAIDILSKNPEKLNATQRYYVVGAMRSNILKCDDNSIKKYLDLYQIDERLKKYIEISKTMKLSQMVKYIYDDSNILGVYSHFDDIEQRVVNLYKFLMLCQDYENSKESNLYRFLSLVENAIYFSDSKEDEAFFNSENTKSIEICSIHSTKGLAYPLVLLGNSEKGLYSQITSDSLKHNNLTIENEKKEIVGFKVDNYTPLSHRILKEIDKLKHLAEKKRLLYVALTRAENDVIISASLTQTKKGDISLREDSYLSMISKSLEIEKGELYGKNEKYCVMLSKASSDEVVKNEVLYVEHSLKQLDFTNHTLISATSSLETNENVAIKLGSTTHKIIEFYWDSFDKNQDKILDKMMIFETSQRESIIKNIDNFYKSEIYKLLKDGVIHHFELEFNVDNKTGFIDFIYFDKNRNGWVIVDFKSGKINTKKEIEYQKQLDFYKDVLENLGYIVVDSILLWL